VKSLPIKLDINSIVNVMCFSTDCKFNLANNGPDVEAACNFKHVLVGKGGKCEMYAPLDNDDKGEQ
jgi:hypothetical protein